MEAKRSTTTIGSTGGTGFSCLQTDQYFVFCVALEIKSRAPCMPAPYSFTERHLQPSVFTVLSRINKGRPTPPHTHGCKPHPKPKARPVHRQWEQLNLKWIVSSWRYEPVIPALGRSRQENREFKVVVGYIVRLRPA